MTSATAKAPTSNTAATTAVPGARRLIQQVAFVILLLIAVMRGLSPFFEPDLWWHLRVGEEILNGGGLYGPDPWAALADKPYLATQWLPEAIAAGTYRLTGIAGILWLRSLVILAIAVVVFVAARRLAGRLAATLAAALAILGSGASLNPRPQLLSFLFFSIAVYAWVRSAEDHQPRWWLVPLFWVWACSHGLWAFGVLFGCLVTVALVADRRTRPSRAEVMRLALLNVACLTAVAITPLGPRLVLAPFEVAGNASWIAEEWRATPVNNAFAIIAVTVVVATALLWTRAEAPLLWQIAVLGLAAVLTLWMWRLVPLGCIAAAPVFGAALQKRLPTGPEELDTQERLERRYGTFAAAVLAAVLCGTSLGATAARYPGSMAPVDSALTGAPDGSVVFADFGVSGWLLWKHPELVPAADLRMEIYSPDYLKQYIAAGEARPGWQQFLTRIGARYALLETDSAIADALQKRGRWTVVARSPKFVLLSAPDGPSS